MAGATGSWRLAALALVLLGLAPGPRASAGPGSPAPTSSRDVSALLEPILARHDVPGMAGAILVGDHVAAAGAAGVRRRRGDAKVTVEDKFHLGSCTKAMTATLVAMLVEERKLAWDTSPTDVFEDLASRADSGWKKVTLAHLLVHRGGAPASLDADGLWGRLWAHKGTPIEQRLTVVEGVLRHPPESAPREKYVYSNAGFAIAGAMAEKVTGKAWEDLMRERLFGPLGMTSAGFGPPGTRDVLDQPRAHTAKGEPVEPGPGADNPAAIGPAGTVHCSIADWAKFVALHLAGAQGRPSLLKEESFARLHTPPQGADYAMGWIVTRRDWGGGEVMTHAGSNTMWFCVVWMAPRKDFAVLVACNQGGDGAAKACDEAASALIEDHVAKDGERPR